MKLRFQPELVFLNDGDMGDERTGRLLLLSVGYGQGHHSAAAALAEQYEHEGWVCRTVDVCAEAQPAVFRCTQMFYEFCVRRAPWLWGVTYSLTDTADWARMVKRPLFARVLKYTQELLQDWKPDLIICTYPLFAYILDELRHRGVQVAPYALVVTDAREISRPWLRSAAELVLVPDCGSGRMLRDRYASSAGTVIAAGFPVRCCFVPAADRRAPDKQELRILYGAYRQTQGVVNDITALLSAFPQLRLTVLAGQRAEMLERRFLPECTAGRLKVLRETREMHRLMRDCHFYIGKAGAATMFECYAANVPLLVNFILPGQEQGNLELLLEDAAGCHVESTAHLVATLSRLLENEAAGWRRLCASMRASGRSGSAARIAGIIRDKFRV